jgi:hypothetical protein
VSWLSPNRSPNRTCQRALCPRGQTNINVGSWCIDYHLSFRFVRSIDDLVDAVAEAANAARKRCDLVVDGARLRTPSTEIEQERNQ